ncbi:luciferase-like domain-containing protein [Aspergillus falconensis]
MPSRWLISDAIFNLAHLKSFIRKLEDAKFDAFFMADHLAVLNMPVEALKRSHTVTSFEPFTLLSALSQATEKIGNGRAAWNIVTTSNPESAKNFGKDEHLEHSERYKRAREFYDVVTGLWDSFADDAFIRDKESGIFLDPEKMHVLNYHEDDLKVWGPLNIARPVQGGPAIVQAGQSEPGRQLAAETAEAVFCSPRDLEGAKALYKDIKGRVEAVGRERNHIKILPAAFILVGDSVEEAKRKRLELHSLVHYDSAIASLSIALWADASGFDPDGPLPTDLPDTNASKTSRAGVVKLAEDERLTVRQLAQRLGGYSGLAVVGTPESIAEEMETWLREEGADGFTVVPELQRRGIFSTDYTGNTLREHLGLPRPQNRFFT